MTGSRKTRRIRMKHLARIDRYACHLSLGIAQREQDGQSGSRKHQEYFYINSLFHGWKARHLTSEPQVLAWLIYGFDGGGGILGDAAGSYEFTGTAIRLPLE